VGHRVSLDVFLAGITKRRSPVALTESDLLALRAREMTDISAHRWSGPSNR
jgi:hypothetical protein